MPLVNGFRIGGYEIIALLGKGGMGEVYRARDTKLKRDVALKVLPDVFASDPGRMLRFQREAEVLASLNHPNIAHIYGVEDRALVMELVEGESPKGPMSFEDAGKIALQMAEALEYAHDRGIVHRDLKPANVKVTPEGMVKLLDFGLAKAYSGSPGSAEGDPENSPTVTLGATVVGTVMGTAAYMAPEQASGKPVDKRADIWSFGVLLWEMLTGKQLFSGETISHTLADVLRAPIDFGQLPASTPGPIQELLKRCLDRDVKTRLRDIGEARVTIARYLADPVSGPGSLHGLKPHALRFLWAVAIVLLILLATISFLYFRERPPERQVLRYTIAAPEKTSIERFAISPDGHYVVIAATSAALSVRSLDSLETQSLPGTDGATYPFWSPDSRYIGFFAQGKLKKIAVNGGPAQTLCDAAPNARGGSWSGDGVILFAPASTGGLSRVPAVGGIPVQVTKPEGGSDRDPVFLPDSRRFLYVSSASRDDGVHLGSLDSSQTRRLFADASYATYFNRHVLFVRDGTLMAQPVDPKTLEPKGDLFPVAEQVLRGRTVGDEFYSTSANGTLIYETGGSSFISPTPVVRSSRQRAESGWERDKGWNFRQFRTFTGWHANCEQPGTTGGWTL